MKYILAILFILIIQNATAVCEEGQIDINSASEKELEKLYMIGPARAQAIVGYRSDEIFKSVDDLEKVSGIGEKIVEGIKQQGLACVEESEEKEEENKEIEDKEGEENVLPIEPNIENTTTNKSRSVVLGKIILNPQNIKTDEDKENSGRSYAKYWIVFFVFLLVLLFAIKIRKRKLKSEFEDE